MKIPHNIEATKWNGYRVGYSKDGYAYRICGKSGEYVASSVSGHAGLNAIRTCNLQEMSDALAKQERTP